MEFPLVFFLIPYAIIVLVASLLLIFNLFHLQRYGMNSTGTRLLMAAYITCFFALLGGSGALLLTVDWTQTLTPNDIITFPSNTGGFGL